MFVRLLTALLFALALCSAATPQVIRQPGCPSEFGPRPSTPEGQKRWDSWQPYSELLPRYAAKLPGAPDHTVVVPLRGLAVGRIADTFGAPRPGGRRHEGQDLFARRGTPVYSATAGFVWLIGESPVGGRWVYTVGAGGRRYYYAHLDRFAPRLREGQAVTTNTLLGYVGTTGDAEGTPPHLHFEINAGLRRTCDYRAINPLPLFVRRP